MAAIVECATCGESASIKPAKLKERNFCSHACYWKAKERKVPVTCNQCGNSFDKIPANVGEKNFCDRKCLFEFKRGENHPGWVHVHKDCRICGKEVPHYRARRSNGQYCSVECKNKGRSGENSPWWKGGIWPYGGNFSKGLRSSIRDRDGDRCSVCKTKKYGKRNLHVHHIDMNKMNDDPNNLITLCAQCHKRVHVGQVNLDERYKAL